MGSQPDPGIQGNEVETTFLQQFFNAWLNQASPELLESARLAALPHWFDLEILTTLHGEASDISAKLQQLEQEGMVERSSNGRYVLQPFLRQLLLQQWQIEARNSYQEANRRAAAYYQASQGKDSANDAELVYHQLGADEPTGLALLNSLLDQAWETRMLGQIEHLLTYANEQIPVLGEMTQNWVRFYQARFDLTKNNHARAETVFKDLLDKELTVSLRSETLIYLAEVLLADRHWSEAFACFEEALPLLLTAQDQEGLGHLYEARGLAYLRLASWLGGMSEQRGLSIPIYRKAFIIYQRVPLLLYRWFFRRLNFLPNLYFSTNYQDWFIVRILSAAEHEFEEAVAYLNQALTEPIENIINIQIRLADIYYRLNRWSLADRLRRQLATSPTLQNNQYKQAVLNLTVGKAAISRHQWSLAEESLQSAYATLLLFSDHENLAKAAALLAHLALVRQDVETAVVFYIESAHHAMATNDLIFATDSWWQLVTIRQEAVLSDSISERIKMLDAILERRAYVARFPGDTLNIFFRLAAYFALPLAYTTGQFLRFLFILFVGIIELNVEIGQTGTLSLIELVTTLLMVLIILTATIWAYYLVYVLLGGIIVRRLTPVSFAELKPDYLVTSPIGILVQNTGAKTNEVSWSNVREIVSNNRSWWRIYLALFSQIWLVSSDAKIRIDGITSHYRNLQREIRQYLASGVTWHRMDFSFFKGLHSWLALFLSAILALVEFSGVFDPDDGFVTINVRLGSGNNYELIFTSILYFFLGWAFIIFPLLGLIVLLYQRKAIRHIVGGEVIFNSVWLHWMVVFLFLMVFLFKFLNMFR